MHYSLFYQEEDVKFTLYLKKVFCRNRNGECTEPTPNSGESKETIGHLIFEDEDVPEKQLLDLLCKKELSDEGGLLEKACDKLFRHPSERTLDRIGEIVDGPNGNEIVTFVNAQYGRSFLHHNIDFCLSNAKFRIELLCREGKDPIKEALKLYNDACELVKWLGITMIGLLLPEVQTGKERLAILCERVSEHVAQCLKKYDAVWFPLSCFVATRMIMSGIKSGEFFDSNGLRGAALEALEKEGAQTYVMELLALLPIRISPFPVALDGCKQHIRDQLFIELENSVRGRSEIVPEVIFAAYANCGGFERDPHGLAYSYLRVCSHHIRHPMPLLRTEQDVRMEILFRNMARANLLLPDYTTAVDYHRFGSELTEKQKQKIMDLAAELGAPGTGVRTVREAGMAVDIIKYLDSEIGGRDKNVEFLVTKLKLNQESASVGSYIVTRWFYFLCQLGTGTQSLEFFRAFPEILLRPADYPFEKYNTQNLSAEDWIRYMHGVSRVQKGILISLQKGKIDVLEVFKNSNYPEIVDGFPMLLNGSSILEEHPHLADRINTIYGLTGWSVGSLEFSELEEIFWHIRWKRANDSVEKVLARKNATEWRDYYDDGSWRAYMRTKNR